MTTAILVTTYARPDALRRSLPQIVALGCPVLVVDDGSDKARWTRELEDDAIADYLYIPRNRGLAAALNIGLAYWLADKSVDWISYFQDDVDVHPQTLQILGRLQNQGFPVLTGHDAPEHRAHGHVRIWDIPVTYKWSCAGVHIHASAEFWRGVLPIPTVRLGAPKRNGNGHLRGFGSNADWWICRDAPRSSKRLGKQILCVPGLVRTFYWRPEDSSWNAGRKAGEEPPLTNLWTS